MAHQVLDHGHQRLGVADVRALLRLCNALHAGRHESHDRKRTLLDGLRALTGADRASVAVASFPARGGRATAAERPVVVSAIHAGDTRGGGVVADEDLSVGETAAAGRVGDVCPWTAYRVQRRQRLRRAGASAMDWCTVGSLPAIPVLPRPTRGRTRKREGAAGAGSGAGAHFVHSFVPLADGNVVACLSVGRDAGRPRFTGRDRSLVCAMHAEVAWLYRADVVLVSPDTLALPTRVRETLQHLLAGKSEKQIAAEMGLSFNTLHHYVKTLHKHFRVNSRSELLARWVGR